MKEITLEARIENVSKAIEMVDAELERLECPMKAQMQMELAVDEIFTNIASYAYAPGSGEASVRFDFDPAEGMVTVRFEDSGVPYDPLKKKDPDVSLPAEERSISRLGSLRVKKSMDSIHYEYRNGKNVLTLQKKIR